MGTDFKLARGRAPGRAGRFWASGAPAPFFSAPRLLIPLAAAAVCAGCAPPRIARTVTLDTLQAAAVVPLGGSHRFVAANPAALQALSTPLGPRLGLVQVRTDRDWDLLAEAVPQLGRCPDLTAGSLIGLVCWAGTPVDGHWPVEVDTLRVTQGAGLLVAHFEGGTYLPDGTARLETRYVPGLRNVLVVEVNGTLFYPRAPD